MLSKSLCFIGNSSSGIRESASLKIPFVNIGNRQDHREQNSNTINCECNTESIYNAISKAILMKENLSGENVYYKKNSSKLVADKIISIIYDKKDSC